MKTKIIVKGFLIFISILFFGCNDNKNNDTSIQKNTIENINEIKNKDDLKNDIITKKLYGKNFKFNLPYRINAYGNRFYKHCDNCLIEISKDTTLILKKILNAKYINEDGYETDYGISYGYYSLNENVIIEIIGLGWNDIAFSDMTDYHVYIITHDNNGKIIDKMKVAESFNFDNKLIFSEVFFENINYFTIINYDFLSIKRNENNEPIPENVELKPIRYTIQENGIIKEINKLKPYRFKTNLSDYCDFTGIFNISDIDVDYWKIKD